MPTEIKDTDSASTASSTIRRVARRKMKFGRKRKSEIVLERSSNIKEEVDNDDLRAEDEDEANSEAYVPFVLKHTISETLHRQPIYALAFNHYMVSTEFQFATAARNMINIYSYTAASDNFEFNRTIIDNNDTEDYYAIEWCYDNLAKKSVIVAAGKCGHIKIFDPESATLERELFGHGDLVNELRVDPNNSALFASVSKDNSARIWHVRHDRAIVCFAGLKGHLDQILSCDWSPSSKFLVTCSMDHTIRRWKIDHEAKQRIKDACHDAELEYLEHESGSDSVSESDNENRVRMETYIVQHPVNECSDLHTDYVDCVRYIGNFVISKGSETKAHVFRFGHANEPYDEALSHRTDHATTLLATIPLPKCNVWFLKFDILSDYAVFPGIEGTIYIYDLRDIGYENEPIEIKCGSKTMRQICFDPVGNSFVVVTDDSKVHRYKRRGA